MNIIAITLALLLAIHVVGFIYSYLLLYSPYFKSARRQHDNYPPSVFYHRLPLIALNVLSLMALVTFTLYFMGWAFSTVWPPLLVLIAQIAIVLICDDTYFYFFHRLVHRNKFLFKHIHSIHHRAYAPMPLEYIYVHPLEWSTGGLGSFIGFILIYFIFGSISIYAFWGLLIIRNFHELDIHSGIRSVFFKWIPFYGTVEHHDIHHAQLKGNFASTFSFWDKVFGTEIDSK